MSYPVFMVQARVHDLVERLCGGDQELHATELLAHPKKGCLKCVDKAANPQCVLTYTESLKGSRTDTPARFCYLYLYIISLFTLSLL